MPAVIDEAVAFLIADSIAWKQHYAEGVFDMLKRYGQTSSLMPSKKRRMQGTSIEYTVRRYHAHAATATMDPMAPYGKADYAKAARFYVNFDHTNGGTGNDFIKFEVPFRTTWYDIQKQNDDTYKDSPNFLQQNIEQGLQDVKEKIAKHIHLPNDGKLATIATGGIVNDDSDIFTSGTTYTSGSTAALVKLDPCSAGIIGIGELIEIRSSVGVLRANYVRVTNRHPYDNTISVSLTSDSVSEGGTPVSNLDSVAATDNIYLQGGYNTVAKGSLDHFFTPSVSYYGRDRLDPEYHVLQGKRIDVSGGGSAVQLTADHFRYVGEMAAWAAADENGISRRAIVMSRNEYRGVSKLSKDEEIKIAPSKEGDQFHRAFGFTGQTLYDPNLGTVMLVVDGLAKFGKIDFLSMEGPDGSGWEMVTPVDGGFHMIPGTHGFWTRVAENDGSGQMSLRYEANGFQLFAIVCTNPVHQIRMQGLSTSM
jgi:hypothetical protein